MSALDELRKKPHGQMTRLEFSIAWHGATREELEIAAKELFALYTRIVELERAINDIVEQVTQNAGIRNEYQDFQDVYEIQNKVMPKASEK